MSRTVRHQLSENKRVAIECKGGRAKQSMRDECDINNIMRKFSRTGFVTHVSRMPGSYGDASALSFHEAMDIIKSGEATFAALPAVLRKRFGNDPAEFLSFCQDPKNLDEMRKLGLAKPETVTPTPATPSEESGAA